MNFAYTKKKPKTVLIQLLINTLNMIIRQFQGFCPYFAYEYEPMDEKNIEAIYDFLQDKVEFPEIDKTSMQITETGPKLIKEIFESVITEIEQVRKGELKDISAKSKEILNVFFTNRLMNHLPSYKRLRSFVRDNRILQQVINDELLGIDPQKMSVLIHGYVAKLKFNYQCIDEEMRKEFREFVLEPDDIFAKKLEHLAKNPPIFILASDLGQIGKYFIPPTEQLRPILQNLRAVYTSLILQEGERLSSLLGDALEIMIERYLSNYHAEFLCNLPPNHPYYSVKRYSLITLTDKQPFHFKIVQKRVKVHKKTFPELFSHLDNIEKDKPWIELDIVATHSNGISIIAESKFSLSSENLKEYYYNGTDKKMAEGKRLKVISDFFNNNPEKKPLIRVPPINTIVPIFITNYIGEFFADTEDGVLKINLLEIFFPKIFLNRVKTFSTTVTGLGYSLAKEW